MKFTGDSFINVQNVRKLIKSKNRRAGKLFLVLLNDFVRYKVELACSQHNGPIVTLGPEVAVMAGIKINGGQNGKKI